MAYKQKDQSIIAGSSAHKSALKKASHGSSHNYGSPHHQGHTRDWDSKDMKSASQGQHSGKSLNELVAMRKGVAKGSNQYNKIQNAINKQMGVSKRYDVGADSTKTNKKGRVKSESTTDLRGATDTKKYDKKGRVRKTTDQSNRSTYDAASQTGSSGLGMQETTKKFKKSGEAKRKTKTRYSMGTDTKKDDKRTVTTMGKRKQKQKTVDPSEGKRGTVTKTKHFTKGKKAGTSKTKVRQKGKLFGKKVEVDYS
tara:strand:+ start:580 stop:1338 length:759 start_codon:yes stop_codon:yes gene_type:complete